MEKMVVVGCFGKPHGIRGWLRINSYTQPADNILHYPHWFIQKQDRWEALDMAAVQFDVHENGHMYIKLPACETPETARLYVNVCIGVTRDQLPALSLGDYYWSDLEGLAVINHEGLLLGKVSHLLSTGSNDVLVVKGDRERLVPYTRAVITEVNIEKGQIHVDWDADF